MVANEVRGGGGLANGSCSPEDFGFFGGWVQAGVLDPQSSLTVVLGRDGSCVPSKGTFLQRCEGRTTVTAESWKRSWRARV